ncbi:MAG: hypothetical protein AB7O73_10440, partial [Bacteroidia bacterium]
MKGNAFLLIVIVSIFGLTSCGPKEPEKPKYQAFEIMEGDTINIVDEKGLKQGMWYFFASKGKKAKKE